MKIRNASDGRRAAAEIRKQAQRLKKLVNYETVVGVVSNATYPPRYENDKPLTIVQNAHIHEYGAQTGSAEIPARSFLGATFLTNQGRYKEALAEMDRLYRKFLITDTSPRELYTQIGGWAYNRVMEAFETRGFGEWQLLRTTTILRKGSDVPLIDEGYLRASILFEVRTK